MKSEEVFDPKKEVIIKDIQKVISDYRRVLEILINED